MPPRSVRLYVVSDIHASEKGWRKMLNAARLRLYDADAVLYAGDLTGKAMVPVVPSEEGFEAELGGQRRLARTDRELAQLEQDIANLGYPVSEPFDETDIIDDQTHRVQYFERARLQLAEGQNTPERISLGPLGLHKYRQRYGKLP